MGLFGGGNSSSTTSYNTNNADLRAAAGDESFVVTGSDNVLTDYGSITEAVNLANQSIQANRTGVADVLDFARDLFAGALKSSDAARDSSVAAFTTATEPMRNTSGLDDKTLTLVGMGLAAAVGIFYFMRRG